MKDLYFLLGTKDNAVQYSDQWLREQLNVPHKPKLIQSMFILKYYLQYKITVLSRK